ncbi:hypothetical protein [Spirillospora sp. CA-294931]|uniref:hypothetical protein n=1 Tax=Spirillospora sp. CA-294931 TaxID=3240042 RepID=UPI003D91E63D
MIHKSLLVERFPSDLAAALREHNRLYAAERAHRRAVRSVLAWYLRTADEARKILFPHPAVPLTVEDAGRPP